MPTPMPFTNIYELKHNYAAIVEEIIRIFRSLWLWRLP